MNWELRREHLVSELMQLAASGNRRTNAAVDFIDSGILCP